MDSFILLYIVFLLIIYQDFRERAISSWTIPCIVILSVYQAITSLDWEPWFLGFNLLFIAIQLAGITLYFSLKHRQWVNVTKDYLGWGDILFFIAISPLFSPLQFCCFFIGALLLTLIGVGVYRVCIGSVATIPLAGAMCINLLGYCFLRSYCGFSFYNDWYLLQFIYG